MMTTETIKLISLTITNNISEIARLLETVYQFGRNNKLSDDIIYEVKLTLEELVTNIINYGHDDGIKHYINIEIALSGNLLTLKTQDEGKPFNPIEHESKNMEKPFEEREIGGMGIYIVRNLMDEIVYKRKDSANILMLKKFLKPI